MIRRANTKAIHGGQGHEVRAGASIAIIVKLHELVKEHICMSLWVSMLALTVMIGSSIQFCSPAADCPKLAACRERHAHGFTSSNIIVDCKHPESKVLAPLGSGWPDRKPWITGSRQPRPFSPFVPFQHSLYTISFTAPPIPAPPLTPLFISPYLGVVLCFYKI